MQTYGYKGYKVTVPAELLDQVLSPDKWPAHVTVRRFYQPRVSRNDSKPVREPVSRSKQLTRSASEGRLAG